MTYADYDAIPAIRWGILSEMMRSPKQYQYRLTHPRGDTPSLILGRATHTAVFEPDRFPLEYVVWTGGRRGTNEHKAWLEQQDGHQELTESEYARCLAIRDSVRAHPVAVLLLTKGKAEQTVTWTDAATGLACKARLDWTTARSTVEFKTTRSIAEWSFARDVVRYHYIHEIAFHRRGLIALGKVPSVRIIAVESDPPHDVCVYRVGEDVLCAADVEVDDLLARVAECEASGQWPGAFPDTVELHLPWYAFDEDSDSYESGAVVLETKGA